MKVKDLILEITGIDFDYDISIPRILMTESLKETLEREVKVSHTPMFHEQISTIEEIKYDGENDLVIIKID